MNLLFRACVGAAAVALLLAAPAGAAEKLRVGKAVPEAFSFVPLDVGMRKGFFVHQQAAAGIDEISGRLH